MLGLSIKTESAHVDLYTNTCRHRHSLFSSYNIQEGELLRACCSDNCVIWSKGDKCCRNIKRTGMIRVHHIPSVVFVVSEANKPLATCKVLGYLTQI